MNKSKTIIIGGGLWGGLLAYHLTKLRPEINFELHEKEDFLGGNHTWSFHQSDLDTDSFKRIEPFIEKTWKGHTVSFPSHSRSLEMPYCSITSERFHDVLRETLPNEKIFFKSQIRPEEFEGAIVFDARNQHAIFEKCGYQKFLGIEVELFQEHGLSMPILMDAKVEQKDGFRFIYYLPWTSHRILIEDTRYSNDASLNLDEMEEEIKQELDRRNWKVEKVVRKESGVLPIPINPISSGSNNQSINLSGIFHDVTGYSLPDAIRLINEIVKIKDWNRYCIQECVNNYRHRRKRDRAFFRLLNCLLFQAAEPHLRFQVLSHFYQLPQALIERFYSGEMKKLDYIRIFTGKPPVKITSALQAIFLNQKNTEEVL